MKTKDTLTAWEIQACIGLLLAKAQDQQAAEHGTVAAAVSVSIATRGPAAAVDYFRDLADLIERDAVLPAGASIQ